MVHMNAWNASKPARGDHEVLTSTFSHEGETHNLTADGWSSTVLKTFIATCGKTIPGVPHDVKRHKVTEV